MSRRNTLGKMYKMASDNITESLKKSDEKGLSYTNKDPFFHYAMTFFCNKITTAAENKKLSIFEYTKYLKTMDSINWNIKSESARILESKKKNRISHTYRDENENPIYTKYYVEKSDYEIYGAKSLTGIKRKDIRNKAIAHLFFGVGIIPPNEPEVISKYAEIREENPQLPFVEYHYDSYDETVVFKPFEWKEEKSIQQETDTKVESLINTGDVNKYFVDNNIDTENGDLPLCQFSKEVYNHCYPVGITEEMLEIIC